MTERNHQREIRRRSKIQEIGNPIKKNRGSFRMITMFARPTDQATQTEGEWRSPKPENKKSPETALIQQPLPTCG